DFPSFLVVHYGHGSDGLVEEARLRQRYWRRVANYVAPELLLLRLLAAADGHVGKRESDIIAARGITLVGRRDLPSEREALRRYTNRLSGTRETVAFAM